MAGEKKPRSKSKHRSNQVWKKFKVDGSKVSMVGRFCPRCGPGILLAEHKNRVTCGKCRYSETKK